MSDTSLLARIDRIESHLAIQQLPARYAIAVDSRDVDAWVNLFIEDVNCGRHGKGRDVLRGIIDASIRTFYRSIHHVCGHVVNFIDADHAEGTVYCRAEHEDSGQWIVMGICYFDTYERRDGRWYFVRRKEQHWYSTDVLNRPGQPAFDNWPGHSKPGQEPALPQGFPTWKGFWERSAPAAVAELTAKP